ncbi:glycosyl hydrolase [Flavobacterium sp.]|uniref:glycosyl hydrolase n=1 Tax=Flavobacterium sp. TaxID=239 RepID=UPI00286E93D0|nr:glycosyl hydrolase [Flavobacterium sp.]
MTRVKYFVTTFLLFIGFFANAQNIVWTGNASNNDFFDESNWKISTTNTAPVSGTIDPGLAINLPLEINNVAALINAAGEINLGTGSLSIGFAKLTADSFSDGNVSVNEGGYVDLSSATPLAKEVQVNFTSGIGWIKTLNYSSRLVSVNNIGQIKVNGSDSVYKTNLRLDNYYLKGCIIRSNILSTTPLTVYDDASLQGNSALISVNTIHSGNAIANSMNNKIESFILKKGFMVTFAVANDGIGKSKNYIASDEDLVINSLPKAISNSISFIRIVPWSWVNKKGIGGTTTGLDETWFYRWLNSGESTVDREYAPMCFNLSGANDANDILLYKSKYKATHVMGFNEPDNCNDQGGTNGGCIISNAVTTYKNLMKTGLRMVSPSCTEGAGTGWLKDFYNAAKAQDVRIDVIAVHWYDWGNNPKVNTNPTAQQVFDRFKTYLTKIHNLYGLPIWITEFNANPNRSTAVNLGFMKLALPYLESLDYIERYAWFQPSSGVANYFDATGNYTDVGDYYKNTMSNPSIPGATVNTNSNLYLAEYPNVALNKLATANSSYSASLTPSKAVDGNLTSSTSQWFVNFGVATDVNYVPLPAWIEVDLQGSYTIDSFRIVEDSKALKDFSFQVWDTTLNSGAGGWINALTVTGNPATPLTTYKTFTPVTTTKVRVFITAHNSTNYLRIFELEVYGFANETLAVKKNEKQPFSIYPNPVTKGVLSIIGDQEVQSVEVYTILGTKINIPFNSNQLLVSNLAPNIYFLRINNEYSFKFIKK